MTTALQIVRAAIPNASDSLCDHILWGRTGFPCFGKVTAQIVYKAAYRFKRASDKNMDLCDFCDRIATKNDLCDVCRNSLTMSSKLA